MGRGGHNKKLRSARNNLNHLKKKLLNKNKSLRTRGRDIHGGNITEIKTAICNFWFSTLLHFFFSVPLNLSSPLLLVLQSTGRFKAAARTHPKVAGYSVCNYYILPLIRTLSFLCWIGSESASETRKKEQGTRKVASLFLYLVAFFRWVSLAFFLLPALKDLLAAALCSWCLGISCCVFFVFDFYC